MCCNLLFWGTHTSALSQKRFYFQSMCGSY